MTFTFSLDIKAVWWVFFTVYKYYINLAQTKFFALHFQVPYEDWLVKFLRLVLGDGY